MKIYPMTSPWVLRWSVLIFLALSPLGVEAQFGRGNSFGNDLAKGVFASLFSYAIFWIVVTAVVLIFDYYLRYKRKLPKNWYSDEYGEKQDQFNFAIGGDVGWDVKKAAEFGKALSEKLVSKFKERILTHYPPNWGPPPIGSSQCRLPDGAQFAVDSEADLVDDQTVNRRPFFAVQFKTAAGVCMSYLVNYQSIGNFCVAHHLVYLKGITNWRGIIAFVALSPLTFIFWLPGWFFSGQSLLAPFMDVTDTSMYESLDLDAFYNVTHESILEATEEVLKAHGLLTEEIQTIINNQITHTNITNTQNVQVRGSRNTVTGLAQAVN